MNGFRTTTVLTVLALLGATMLAACGDDGGGTGDTGTDTGTDGGMGVMLTIEPALQNFGDVVVGETSADAMFTVTNAGTAVSPALASVISGSGYEIVADMCAGMTLSAGGTCMITVNFTPSGPGAASGSLTVSAGTASAMATLEGTGLTDPMLSITPTPYDFGTNVVSTVSAAQTFTITNTGESDSGTIMASLSGSDATQFMIETDGCMGMTLGAGATCTVDVVYAPTAAGSHSADLLVSASPGGSVTGVLSGTAVRPAALQLVPGSQDFGSVTEGMSSATVDFTLTNTGGVDTGTIDHTFGGTDAGAFSVTTSTCSGITLAGGASCTITVRFNSALPEGAKSATLDVTDGTLMASSTLSATTLSMGNITITPSTFDFGSSPVGTATGATTFTIDNPGGSPVSGITVAMAGANAADFPINSDGCSGTTIAAGGSCTVAVVFNPTTAGARSAMLRVQGASGLPATAALSGTGESPAVLSVTPTASNFGDVAVGGMSTNVVFTVTNTGTATSGVPSAALIGGGATHWNLVANGCTAALTGGATCMITVRFEPTAAGPQTAQLEVTATPGGRDVSDLTGNGVDPSNIRLNPTTVNYGMVAETDTASSTITLQNVGTTPISGISPSISGADNTNFTILPSSTCGATLAGSSTCTYDVQFAPGQDAKRAFSASLDVNYGAATVSAALNGTGIADILLEPVVAGDTFDYGDVPVGNTLDRQFRVTNQTTRALSSVTLVAPGTSTSAEFYRTASTCGTSLASSASCTVTIRFAPTGSAGARTSPFTVTGSGMATETATLDGNAVGPIRFTAVAALSLRCGEHHLPGRLR